MKFERRNQRNPVVNPPPLRNRKSGVLPSRSHRFIRRAALDVQSGRGHQTQFGYLAVWLARTLSIPSKLVEPLLCCEVRHHDGHWYVSVPSSPSSPFGVGESLVEAVERFLTEVRERDGK